MMIGMIVLCVLVHVHRRSHGGRDNQGMREQESDETPHNDQSTTAPKSTMSGCKMCQDEEEHVATHVARVALVRVLKDWCPPFAGYSRSPEPMTAAPAPSAFIEALRL
jgi:hypothetical protein